MMKNIAKEFIDAKVEFSKSNGSEKSVENLYDIVYFLEALEKPTFDEEYILAKIYNILGHNIYASKIIDKSLKKSDLIQTVKLKELQSKIESRDIWNTKIYRDLRDSKIKKDSTKLNTEDFIVFKDIDGSFCIKISEEIKNIVLFNKNFPNEDFYGSEEGYLIFTEKEPDAYLLESLIEYIIWLGQIKDEILNFYNGVNFRRKLPNVAKEWFDGLSVFDFSISVDRNDDFNTEIILLDYLQNNFGFRLEIENKNFKKIEYDPLI